MRVIKIIFLVTSILIVAVVTLINATPQRAASIAIGIERFRCGLTKKEVTLDNGLKYVYLEGGKGEPLILLHGFGANKDNFTRACYYLTSRYRVISVDHIGFGESSHPKDADYSPPAQAERLHKFAQKIGLKKAHIGGSSMGGHIAATWAALHPEFVQSLWLLDPGGVWSGPKSELREIIEKTGKNPLIAKNEEEFRRVYDFVQNKKVWLPGFIIKTLAEDRKKNYELENIIFKGLAADSIEKRVTGLKTPSLIVWGEKDRVLHPGSAKILDQLMPNTNVIIMKDIGHLPMIEDAEKTCSDYIAYRDKLKTTK